MSEKLKKLFWLRVIFCACFLTLSVCAVYSASVSVLVCQKDKTQTDIRYMSNFFAEQIMDYLFDRGHIVSEGTTIISEGEETSYQIALDATMNGYFDYLVYFVMEYSSIPSTNPDALHMEDLNSVDWKVIRISDNVVVSNENVFPEIKNGENAEIGLSKFSKQIASRIDKSLVLR